MKVLQCYFYKFYKLKQKSTFGQVFFRVCVSHLFFVSFDGRCCVLCLLHEAKLAPRFLFIQIYIYFFSVLRLSFLLFSLSLSLFSLDLLNNLERNAWHKKRARLCETLQFALPSHRLVRFLYSFFSTLLLFCCRCCCRPLLPLLPLP